MEKLAFIAVLINLFVIGCVGWTCWSIIRGIFSLFGGVCIGC